MTNMIDDPACWQIKYLGWSGFHISNGENNNFFIDPPKGTIFSESSKIIIFITHGHPEHLGGVLELVRNERRKQRIQIIASKTVIRYLERENRNNHITFLDVDSGYKNELTPNFSFEVFSWRHMPLLPPGFKAAIRHIIRIIMNFPAAWRIIRMSLKGPKGAGEMLGYLLHLSGNKNIIIYGEGLHRNCRVEDVAVIGQKAPGATLLVASEPEDIDELPGLVAASGAAEAILYEPHRPWRDIFKLPHIDLKRLQQKIAKYGITVKIT